MPPKGAEPPSWSAMEQPGASMPETNSPIERVVIGIVVGSHGLQGTLKIDPRTDFPERYEVLKTCWLCRGKTSRARSTSSAAVWPSRHIADFSQGIKTRDEADTMRGATIEIPMSERWTLPENLFYISDLMGCQAVDESGKVIGTVDQVLRGSQDILVIQSQSGEFLVPFVNEWVGHTDVSARTVVIKAVVRALHSEEIPPALGESDH